MALFCKSYENVLIRVFLHAEFISALKTEKISMDFEKYAKNGIKNIYYNFFLFSMIFSKSFKQNLIIPIESCFLDRKKAKYSYISGYEIFGRLHENRQAIASTNIQA